MSFKIFLIGLISILLLSCGLKVGEEPLPPKTIKVAQKTCLRELNQKIDTYLDSQLSEAEITQLMECAGETLDIFVKEVDGKKKDEYKPSEISHFINKYFTPEKKISEQFMNSIMEIKVGLVGGTTHSILKSEMNDLKVWIDIIKTFAINLRPYISSLSIKEDSVDNSSSQKPDNINDAVNVLRAEVKKIAKKLYLQGSRFNLFALSEFLNGYRSYKGQTKGEEQTSDSAIRGIIKIFNSIALGPSEKNEIVEARQWLIFSDAVIDWYSIWLQYKHNIVNNKILFGNGLNNFQDISDQVIMFIKKSIDRQPKKVITYEQVYELIDALDELGLIPKPFRAISLKTAAKPLFGKIFGDYNLSIEDRKGEGVDRVVIAEIESEFQKWVEIQRFIEKKYNSQVEMEVSNNNWKKIEIKKNTRSELNLSTIFLSSKSKDSHFVEMEKIIESVEPYFSRGSPKAVVASKDYKKSKNIVHNFYNLSLMNIFRAGLRLINRGYSADIERAQKMQGLTEHELQVFTEDVHLLGEDFNLMPPGLPNAGRRIFLEGNLFTHSGNGVHESTSENSLEHLMSFNEGIELVTYLYSSLTINKKIYGVLNKECLNGPKDVFGRHLVYAPCFRKNIRKLLIDNIENLPGMHAYIKSLPVLADAELDSNDSKIPTWNEFENAIVDVVLNPLQDDSNWLGYIHVGKLTMILHYVETLITRFDEDVNGYVDEEEGMKAFPLFSGLIKKVAKQRCENLYEYEVEMAFKYILAKAEVPGIGMYLGSGDIYVDRLQGLKIFKNLISDLRSVEKKDCKSWWDFDWWPDWNNNSDKLKYIEQVLQPDGA